MAYTMGEAARASGTSKPTILRAIKSGRLSATRNDDGSYTIDPSELHRAFPVTGNGVGAMKQSETGKEPVTERSDATEQRDRLIREQGETILDLRTRLDANEAERRAMVGQLSAAQEKITALLTDQRVNNAPEKFPIRDPPAPPASVWRRFLKWRR